MLFFDQEGKVPQSQLTADHPGQLNHLEPGKGAWLTGILDSIARSTKFLPKRWEKLPATTSGVKDWINNSEKNGFGE